MRSVRPYFFSVTKLDSRNPDDFSAILSRAAAARCAAPPPPMPPSILPYIAAVSKAIYNILVHLPDLSTNHELRHKLMKELYDKTQAMSK